MATRNRTAEDWVPVRGINGGAIILNNRDKVTGVKIDPRNIFILENQNN